MLTEILWPKETHVEIDDIRLHASSLTIVAHGTQTSGSCPSCGQESGRINSYYCRHPADLPCAGYSVELELLVPRFFCDNDKCRRVTFAAAFPALVAPYARRTERLAKHQNQIGFVTCAEEGAHLLAALGMATSADTLIRMVRDVPERTVRGPRVLGVDDWAMRKGHTYGTILVDLEQHQVVDLLEERSAESLKKWLRDHPGVEIICRDRGKEYIEGATAGAPDAIQIADRFHLLQNLVDVLKRMLAECPMKLREAVRAVTQEMRAETGSGSSPESATKIASPVVEPNSVPPAQPTLQELRFAEVKELQEQGWSRRAVAKELDMDRRTVSKYFSLESYPRRGAGLQSYSTAYPYLGYLTQRWHEGCQEITKLYAEVQTLGFKGHYSSVYRLVKQMLRDGRLHAALEQPLSVTPPRLSVTGAVWLLIHPEERLDDVQKRLRDQLCQVSDRISTASTLARSFRSMVQKRCADALDPWLNSARESGIKPFVNFSASLQSDYEAVKAALTHSWSSGQIEGQVNRLKLIKRKMYGRANFDLLRKQVLGIPMVL